MVQSKLFGTFANDVSSENTQHLISHIGDAKEIRPLNDLELMIIGGGDAVICWTPAP
jgi:hypothetical protein